MTVCASSSEVIFGADLSLAYAGERRAFVADLPVGNVIRQLVYVFNRFVDAPLK